MTYYILGTPPPHPRGRNMWSISLDNTPTLVHQFDDLLLARMRSSRVSCSSLASTSYPRDAGAIFEMRGLTRDLK